MLEVRIANKHLSVACNSNTSGPSIYHKTIARLINIARKLF